MSIDFKYFKVLREFCTIIYKWQINSNTEILICAGLEFIFVVNSEKFVAVNTISPLYQIWFGVTSNLMHNQLSSSKRYLRDEMS